MAGWSNIHIDKAIASGGGGAYERRVEIIEASASAGQKYYALVVNCGNDSKVKSDIRDHYQNLVSKGYDAIVGIRDVHPEKRADIPRLRKNLNKDVPTDPIKPRLILAVMEVEAWIIAETSHFVRVDKTLTADVVAEEIGFDPRKQPVDRIDHPAVTLDRIYRRGGTYYDKDRSCAERTVDALDYFSICFEAPARSEGLAELVLSIDEFLSE